MGKSGRKRVAGEAATGTQVEGSSQRLLHLAEVLVNVRGGLRDLVIGSGLQVLEAMLEEDREALCGPIRKKQEDRQAYRYGHDRGQLVLGGRKISVPKPRVRSVAGREMQLSSWEAFSSEDPLQDRVMQQILVGVSSRGYEKSLEELPPEVASIGVKKSSVSRRFVARTSKQVEAFMSRPLGELDLPIIMIDGTELGEHLLLVALGIDWTGRKYVLGVREGVTESYETCRSLLRDLIGRGLVVERARLFVIDGSKGLRKAIRKCFGQWARVHRCHVHKVRNVLDHLPSHKRPWVGAQMRRAWHQRTAAKARADLLRLAAGLENEHPGAAGSLREGLEETLTLMKLGARGSLYKTLRSTNPIENIHDTVKRVARNVKRWRGGSMVLRWAVTGLMEAESRFRRINGYRQMPALLAQLESNVREEVSEADRKIA